MRSSQIFSVFLIVLVGLIAYSNIFHYQFVYDDLNNIADNPLIRKLDNFIFPSGGYKGYLPRAVGFFTFALNYYFGGLDVTGYHIVNILIHIANAILVYFLVILTFKTSFLRSQKTVVKGQDGRGGISSAYSVLSTDPSYFIAAFSALFFVSHPLQTQAVTYIVQRLTSLATMFYLLSVVMYIKARLTTEAAKGQSKDDTRRQKTYEAIMLYSLSLISAILAMFTKAISFTLPIMVIFYEFIFFRSSMKKKLLFLLPIILTLIIIPLSIMSIDKPIGEILSDVSERIRVQTEMSRWDYLFTEFRVIVTYIRLIFLPVNQNLDYDYPVYHSLFELPVFLSFFLLSLILGFAGYLMHKSRIMRHQSALVNDTSPAPRPYLREQCKGKYRLTAFGIFWFFITLSVTSSVIPITDVIFEHRVYLSSVGAFIALSAVVFMVIERFKARWQMMEKAVILLLAVIVIVLSTATYARNAVWRNELSLWEDVVRKSPGNARGHFNLGVAYNYKGLLTKAIEHLEIALLLKPGDAETYYNLALAYSSKGMADKAIEHFTTAIRLKPDFQAAHYDIGVDYLSLGLFDRAIEHFEAALKLKPNDPAAHNNLGIAYASMGMTDLAIEHFRTALKLKPDFQNAYSNLDLALRSKK